MSSPAWTPPPPPRTPWQLLYQGAHRLRRRWYRRRAGRLPRPVISVGNLHWGGSGKTPLVAAIAAFLRDRGRRVAVLSRGWGGEGAGIRVVSDGSGPLLGPRVAGDEPVWLAGALPGVAVVVGADRLAAGLQALERLEPPPEIFVLDDGFSHLRLARDLDVLALPAADPFGGGRLPPGGRLREPLAAVCHADAVVLTGADPARDDAAALAEGLRRYGFGGPGFASETVIEPAAGLTGPVLVVAAIARPELFLDAVRRQGFEVADVLTFPDHHPYPAPSLERIADAFGRSGARTVLTTGKDHVKLLGRLDLPLAALPVHARPEPAFWRWLEERLAGRSPQGDDGQPT